MAKGQLDAVLHFLRRPFQTRAMAALTDRQLLERFLQNGEEQAFTALLQRHAAMVLRVACRVLHNMHDAEDVFQATFLVLAKKAGMIRQRQALAGWLYQVAYHLALRVKAENAQRHAQERRSGMMLHAAPETSFDHDELRAVLDQELSHLPEKYRTPLVLHYLEGKSKRETAEQLGWSEGTVSGRLARARKLLHRRLLRRGFVLSAAGILTLLAENTATALVSPILLRATIQAALVFAGSIPVASTIPATAVRLAEGLVKKMWLAKLKMVMAVVLTVSVAVAGVGTATYRALAVKAEEDAPPRNAAEIGQATSPRNKQEAPGRTTEPPAPQDGAENALVHLFASGKVVDTQGRPIAGATVYLREIATLRDPGELQNQAYTDILAQTTTDANGHFAFKNVSTKPMRLSNADRHPWNIVITSKGYGVAWHVFQSRHEENLALTMPAETRLHGRLLDSNGKPAVGVRVELSGIDDQLDPDPQNRVFTRDRLQLQRSRLPFAVVTDADGRFVLEGLPPRYHIGLMASDRRFARKGLSCATIDKLQIDRLNETEHVPPESMLLADGFTATLRPAQTVRGQVTYRDQGKPAVGAYVAMWRLYGTFTDSEGRYSLQAFDTARQQFLFVTPPEGANYLAASTAVVVPPNAPTQQLNFALEPGSVIMGQLREQETGKPLRVPYVDVHYQSEEPRRASAFTRTKADGSFRLVVPPGKGKLSTSDSLPGYVPWDLIGDFGGQRFQAIQIKPGETLAGKDILFMRGMLVQGHILDPLGKPVAGAVFQGVTEQSPSGADGSFTLRGLSPQQKSQFLVLHVQRRLGAMMTIEPRKQRDPLVIDVKLQPALSASARVVDENQRPVTDAQVFLFAHFRLREDARESTVVHIPVYGPLRTDAAGKFMLPNLVAGGSYSVKAFHWGYTAAEAQFRVDPGRNPEVPDLVLLASNLPLAGRVLDAAGKPVSGVEVTLNRLIQTPGHGMARTYAGSMRTDRDGQFHFYGLPKGEYLLLATLSKPTGMTNASGPPASKSEARTELRVESGKEDLRIILKVP